MKRIIVAALLLTAAVFSFGEQNGRKNNNAASAKNEQSNKSPIAPPQKVDIDLTKLNYNMATAMIYQILTDESGKYLGKTVRIKGQYAYDETEYGRFDYVLLFDAAACCQTGLMFDDPSRTFPDGYPQLYDDMEIVGIISERTVSGMDMIYIDCR